MTLVSVCVHFLKLLDTQTQKWTQSLTKTKIKWEGKSLVCSRGKIVGESTIVAYSRVLNRWEQLQNLQIHPSLFLIH